MGNASLTAVLVAKLCFRYSGVGWALVFRAAVKEYFWFRPNLHLSG